MLALQVSRSINNPSNYGARHLVLVHMRSREWRTLSFLFGREVWNICGVGKVFDRKMPLTSYYQCRNDCNANISNKSMKLSQSYAL